MAPLSSPSSLDFLPPRHLPASITRTITIPFTNLIITSKRSPSPSPTPTFDGHWRDGTSAEGFIIEGWSEGFLVGALLIMACITVAAMRRGVLLHKLILLEQLLAMSHGTFCFMAFDGYSWYLSSTASLLYCSYFLHNVVAWMKIKPFFVGESPFFDIKVGKRVQWIYLGTLALTVPILIYQIFNNFRFFNNINDEYRTVRPYEPLMRDPWWIFTNIVLLHIIGKSYSARIFHLISRSPRLGILLTAICLAIIFTIMDILASVLGDKLNSVDGINPYWKLSLVFKSLTDAIMIDDFKTELAKLGKLSLKKDRRVEGRKSTAAGAMGFFKRGRGRQDGEEKEMNGNRTSNSNGSEAAEESYYEIEDKNALESSRSNGSANESSRKGSMWPGSKSWERRKTRAGLDDVPNRHEADDLELSLPPMLTDDTKQQDQANGLQQTPSHTSSSPTRKRKSSAAEPVGRATRKISRLPALPSSQEDLSHTDSRSATRSQNNMPVDRRMSAITNPAAMSADGGDEGTGPRRKSRKPSSLYSIPSSFGEDDVGEVEEEDDDRSLEKERDQAIQTPTPSTPQAPQKTPAKRDNPDTQRQQQQKTTDPRFTRISRPSNPDPNDSDDSSAMPKRKSRKPASLYSIPSSLRSSQDHFSEDDHDNSNDHPGDLPGHDVIPSALDESPSITHTLPSTLQQTSSSASETRRTAEASGIDPVLASFPEPERDMMDEARLRVNDSVSGPSTNKSRGREGRGIQPTDTHNDTDEDVFNAPAATGGVVYAPDSP